MDLHNRKLALKAGTVLPTSKRSLRSKEHQYCRFLIFKEFYIASTPVIICEGKTDNVYISHAIRSLAVNFPSLATISASGAPTPTVRLFKYPDTSTGRILNLNGGTGDLKGFIRRYADETKTFKAPGFFHPVIVLLDNDDGKKDITGVVSQLTRKQVTWTEPFLHIVGNLYVMVTPLQQGSQTSMIEDFFTPQTRATIVNGKSFKAKEPIDLSIHYSKHVFAEQVVKKLASSIDFTGFAAILNIFHQIIANHSQRTVP